MSTRSKFERKLGFRQLGFSFKIPDIGRSLKPFDYVVGIPVANENGNTVLRFVAIEAKKARGWTLTRSEILGHQGKALDIVESMSPFSSWIAVGFLDMPKMKLDWNRKPLLQKMKAEAFLIPWVYTKSLMAEGSLMYKDIIELFPEYIMDYGKLGTAYKWFVGKDHPIFRLINP